jgi:transposase-like protein
MSTHNQSSSRGKSPNALPEPLEEFIRQIVADTQGQSLDDLLLQPQSPLKQFIGRFVEIALQEELQQHLGYEPHQKLVPCTEQPDETRRLNTRNGFRPKNLKTSQGELEIQMPRDRLSTFDPQIIPKQGTISQELEQRVLAMYRHGMTTRDIQNHLAELYGLDVDAMFVTRLSEKLDPVLTEWRNRPLEPLYAIVFIDALYLQIRHSTGVQATAFYHLCGYGEKGKLENLGLYLAPEGASPKESASFWHQVLIELKKRGVGQVLIFCSDGLSGLDTAINAVYPEARHQSCVVHMVRNSLKLAHHNDQGPLLQDLKKLYGAVSYEAAEQALAELEKSWKGKYPGIVKQWGVNLGKLQDLLTYGPELRRLVYTTNPIENVNRQLRKVTKNRGPFPNRESALRLLTMVLKELHEKELAKKGRRGDWRLILAELHIHFAGTLPQDWGSR